MADMTSQGNKQQLQREALNELIRVSEEYGLYDEDITPEEILERTKQARKEVAKKRGRNSKSKTREE